VSSDPTYLDRQKEQWGRYLRWMDESGGEEGVVLLPTVLQAHQRMRMYWLAKRVRGKILEVGCNWGYCLAWVGGHAGVDISPLPIEVGKLLNPTADLRVGSAQELPFETKSFDTVMLTEVLEHLEFPGEVFRAVSETCRVAKSRVLVTMPNGDHDIQDATNMKHRWLADAEHRETVVNMFSPKWVIVTSHVEDDFWMLCMDREP
jgi:2-polyprenyl-3-methyl-5-hydroxy-6-metoxy-1,4-benzoquinol methylase